MVRAAAKAAGVTEPLADEKDPAFLAMQIKSLITAVTGLGQVQEQNSQQIYRALAMVDVHQQVLARVTRDLAFAVTEARRMQLAGDFTQAVGDLGDLKLNDERTLNMGAYYEEYRQVADLAGQEAVDIAVVLWSQGYEVEDAVARAKLERNRQAAAGEKKSDPDYEVEHFGGNVSGQNHQQQDEASAQASG